MYTCHLDIFQVKIDSTFVLLLCKVFQKDVYRFFVCLFGFNLSFRNLICNLCFCLSSLFIPLIMHSAYTSFVLIKKFLSGKCFSYNSKVIFKVFFHILNLSPENYLCSNLHWLNMT